MDDLAEIEDLVCGIKIDGCFRHTKDDAARFILGDRECARLVHGLQSPCAVLSHPSQQEADCLCSEISCDRFEEDGDRRTVAVYRFGSIEPQLASSVHSQMSVVRSQVNRT